MDKEASKAFNPESYESKDELLRDLHRDLKRFREEFHEFKVKLESSDYDRRLMKMEFKFENKDKLEEKLRDSIKEEQHRTVRNNNYVITGITIGLNLLFFLLKNFLDK